jgi:Transglycosylase SLT domain
MDRYFQPRRTLAIAALAAFLSAPALAFDAGSAGICQTAGTAAELLHSLPRGLLLAIGRVESGRRDPSTGQVAPWPWTINAAGAGRLFESGSEALDTTRSLHAQGVRSIDVGCFQVNLQHHPDAFTTLENAFDPHKNADYAARFLAGLRARTGSWEAAVAAYHSATPELGGPYRDRVLAGWAGAAAVSPPALVARPNPVMIWTPPTHQGMRVWTPSAPGASPSVIVIRSASGQAPLGQAPRPVVDSTDPTPEVHQSAMQPRLGSGLRGALLSGLIQ